MFLGRYDPELYREYGKWLPYITDIYLVISDSETGDFRFLPFEGGALDQPYMTMQVLKLVQLNYRKHLNEQVRKLKQKSKGRGIAAR